MEKRNTDYQARVYDLIGRMSKRIGINIPKKQYPAVKLTNENTRYDTFENAIFLNKSETNSVDFIGEEIGHFLRDYARGIEFQRISFGERLKNIFGFKIGESQKPREKPETHTDEFFGYLGRKIIREVVKPGEGFDLKKNRIGVTREEMKNLKKYLKQFKDIEKGRRFNPDYTPEEAKKQREEIEYDRRSILHHQRPYGFAEAIDLKKADLQKLYALPNQEVRHRFFRSDPQYDLTKPIQPGRITKRHSKAEREESQLETVIRLIGTIGIFILFILSINPNKLTGYVINIKESYTNPDFLIFILLAILIIIVMFNKFKSKKRKRK